MVLEGICWNLDLDLHLTREKVGGRVEVGGRLEGGGRVGMKRGLNLLLCFLKGIKLVLIFFIYLSDEKEDRRREGGDFFFAFFCLFGLVWFGLV